ncbi:nicotinate (nicotinamide) nucleotide adenylyltransferase [Kwoniella heveanensis CBS 569]|uniref:Nicotinate (Nicotinamide) nucleotide adenylyltransferase n=1 Tax=Kwoniella heveanensis BCC8398 TaxID=1296120 RepID=A0A1B9GX73_9TREE|nr:nicotinate (nicotinamide) nucleotide adenylyltransferase [Kwoniella heveanensis BCC8398]OCF39424.1 nicotinate (nicotinamide) nucleotide adenylyltransferase [Kwoniella heveanensis CBS 569]
MAANGFKSPAPVLPGLGLHSFHNDSPPFAGAATSEQGEPDHISLDPSDQNRFASSSHDDSHLKPELHYQSQHAHLIAPFPNAPINTAHSNQATPTQAQSILNPIPQRMPTFSSDEHLSSSRSRRLVSGYLFGNPPSPVGTKDIPADMAKAVQALQAAKAPAAAAGDAARDSKTTSPRPSPNSEDEGRYPLPTPPIQDRDSPPLSAPYKSYSSPNPNNALALEQSTQALGAVSLNDGPETGAKLNDGGAVMAGSARITGTDTGYDALEGRNDGEADLDLSAPQAEGGGSGAYLRGEAAYEFPRHRLRKTMRDESKIPLVIVACGSFSPPTYLHLRMFEMAKDEIVESQTYEIMAGYYSPVSSYYKKAGLAPANHRVRMCELAVEHTSTWLMVDPWEAGQSEYQRTAVVLDHFDDLLNGGEDGEGGVIMSDGKKRRYKIMLLAGGDLIESFGEPGVWSEPDLHIILGRFGCLIVERAGSDVWAFLLSHDILYHHRRNVIVIKQLIYNDISSTKVRLFVRRGMSIKYLLPNSVIQYIYDNKLYRGKIGAP